MVAVPAVGAEDAVVELEARATIPDDDWTVEVVIGEA